MYKIIYKANTIDVIQNPTFVKILPSGHVAITDKLSANGIIGSDSLTIYGLDSVNRSDIKVVTIEKITEKEFNWLSSQLNSEQKVAASKTVLLTAIDSAIANLSEICKNKITAGFSIVLSDNETYSFKLTSEDQLNLLNFENQLNMGVKTFIYHATGLPCKVFAKEDMQKIIKAYRKHVLYHTTYFNIAKQYLKTLTDIDTINRFTYGTNITGMTKDPAIKRILQDGGSF